MMKVKILSDVPSFQLVGQDWGPFESGEETELPSWCARVLVRKGVAEPQMISSAELRRKIISEENTLDLNDIESDFYSRVRESVSRLREEARNEEAEELKSFTLTLAEVRLPKLLKAVFDPEGTHATFEEKFLLNQISSILNLWTDNLRQFIDGEEARQHGERSV